jgi:hypothetical protein
MGTSISHESCRICGNENEYVSQRCSHLRDHMNEVLPDGRLVSAENFGMRFFDISDVTVPADQAAYSLQKVASTGAAQRNVAVDAASAPAWRKAADIEKHTPASDSLFDVPPEGNTTDAAPETFSDDELITMLNEAGGNLQTVVSTLANAGIVLSPRELTMLTSTAEPTKSAMADCDGFGSIRLDIVHPGVYAVARSKFATRSGYLAPTYVGATDEQAKLAEHGFADVAAYYGFYRDSIRSLSVSAYTKMAHRHPALRELAAKGSVPRALSYLSHTHTGA